MLRSAVYLALSMALLALDAPPAHARESLGLYGDWGAFRDPLVPRCYAIALAQPNLKKRDYQPYAAIGTWPRRGARSQVHFRLSRQMAENARIYLRIGRQRLQLTGGGGDAWALNAADNATSVAAMRASSIMSVSTRDARGRPFTDRWSLPGAASAMDAALIGCAKLR